MPRLSRADVNALGALRRLLGGASAGSAVARWSHACLRARVRCGVPRVVASGSPAKLRARGAQVFELHGPDSTRAYLALDPAASAALSAQLLGLEPGAPAAAPGLAERGLLCYALGWLCSELETSSPWRVVAAPSSTAEARAADLVCFEAPLWLGERRGFAWLCLDRATLLTAPAASARTRSWSAARLRWLRAAPVLLVVEHGRLQLARDELESLAAGDVIVSPSLADPGAGALALRIGRGRFIARREEDTLDSSTGDARSRRPLDDGSAAEERLVVTEGYRDDLEHHPYDRHEASEGDATLTDALPVELVVELGRLHLRGAQALDLQVGDVLTLPRPLQGGVELRVGGTLVGRGELVDVEGEAGVRVLEIAD
ncbi:MAG: type III secretion system cytoplasmic ring protein SctQ [Myxococcales bacterium]|nr:type III secretion system cytoplasmic ring protein SctQ [Myxococcales bacterium]